jgi:hypothetical protein
MLSQAKGTEKFKEAFEPSKFYRQKDRKKGYQEPRR